LNKQHRGDIEPEAFVKIGITALEALGYDRDRIYSTHLCELVGGKPANPWVPE
jgi:hypothetical protein